MATPDGQKLVILGGGESGVGAARLGVARGFDVFLSDQGTLLPAYRAALDNLGVPFEESGHTMARILEAGEVIKSPGIPDSAPVVRALHDQKTPVISEIEFAARYTDAKLIAITGSNGKTTTAMLTYHLMHEAGLSVGLAGNVGSSFAGQVTEGEKDFYVLEVSSFQLDTMYDFRASVAVLLNITPDHLDRYDYDFKKYVASKFRITQNQTADDDFIYFAESPALVAELGARTLPARIFPISLIETPNPGGYLREGNLVARSHGREFSIVQNKLPIVGPHNAINALAAILAAQSVGLTDAQIKAGLLTFRNAPHRLEFVATVDGVQYINDSKATNVDSVFYALGSFDRPVVLILGGVDKGNDYGQLEELIRKKVKGIVALGTDTEKIMDYFQDKVPSLSASRDLADALRTARSWAQPGEIVLLSPACASFDLFKNYQHRGDQFRSQVLAFATK